MNTKYWMALGLVLAGCGGGGDAGTAVSDNQLPGGTGQLPTLTRLSGRFEVVSKECSGITILPPFVGAPTPAMITLTDMYASVDMDGQTADSNAAYLSQYTAQCPNSVPINQGYVNYTTNVLYYYQTQAVVTTYGNCTVTYGVASNPTIPSWEFPYTIAQDGGIVLTASGCTYTYKKDY